MNSAADIKTARDLVDALNVSAPGTRILLGTEHGATIEGAKNKYKNGFAIVIVGKGGKYNVAGTQHYMGTDLPKLIQICRTYINNYNLGTTL